MNLPAPIQTAIDGFGGGFGGGGLLAYDMLMQGYTVNDTAVYVTNEIPEYLTFIMDPYPAIFADVQNLKAAIDSFGATLMPTVIIQGQAPKATGINWPLIAGGLFLGAGAGYLYFRKKR